MKHLKSGFTLIELMIVVAILGILAAIALPSYQTYTSRTQASEGTKVVTGLQKDCALYLTKNGDLSGTAADSDLTTSAGNLEGKYVGSVSMGDECIISIDFTSGTLSGQTMTMTPAFNPVNKQITQWTCTGLVNPVHLPSGCI